MGNERTSEGKHKPLCRVSPAHWPRGRRSINAALAARETSMRRLTQVLAVLLVGFGLAGAASWTYTSKGGWYAGDTIGGNWVLANGPLYAKGGIGAIITNTSWTDTIRQFDLVGWDSTPITVLTKAVIGDFDAKVMTVADSLHNDYLDTLPRGDQQTTQYDTATIAAFRIRARLSRGAGPGANDTIGFILVGHLRNGGPIRMTVKVKSAATLDTILPDLFSRVESIYARGTATTDSLVVTAYSIAGATRGAGYTYAYGPESYAGIAMYTIYPRERGFIRWEGPGKVRVNGTTSTVLNGYFLIPSTTVGTCSTSQYLQFLTIGTVLEYSPYDSTAYAWLHRDYSVPWFWWGNVWLFDNVYPDSLHSIYVHNLTGDTVAARVFDLRGSGTSGTGYIGLSGDSGICVPLFDGVAADTARLQKLANLTRAAQNCSTYTNEMGAADSGYALGLAGADSAYALGLAGADSAYALSLAAADSAYTNSMGAADSGYTDAQVSAMGAADSGYALGLAGADSAYALGLAGADSAYALGLAGADSAYALGLAGADSAYALSLAAADSGYTDAQVGAMGAADSGYALGLAAADSAYALGLAGVDSAYVLGLAAADSAYALSLAAADSGYTDAQVGAMGAADSGYALSLAAADSAYALGLAAADSAYALGLAGADSAYALGLAGADSAYALGLAAADSGYMEASAAADSGYTDGKAWTSWEYQITPAAFALGASNQPSIVQTRFATPPFEQISADFDATAPETAYFRFKVPSYMTGTCDSVYFDIEWTANSASGNSVLWSGSTIGRTNGENLNVAYTGTAQVLDAHAGTAYYLNQTSIAIKHVISANDYVECLISRVANDMTDDLAADAEIVMVRIRFSP